MVNIVSLKGSLMLCGPTELSLAKASFPGCKMNDAHTLMDLGNRVSRKKDYIPAITSSIKAGWGKPDIKRGLSTVDVADLGHLEVDPLDPYQRVMRRGSVLEAKTVFNPDEIEDTGMPIDVESS